ncbi:hypothetical protein ACFFTQ_12935 [Streptomyces roseofulvus]|uniref:hypothetical protein n=1 Tax=Streptomyces roseofulvus TaxID=33902 RepID=UPI0031FDAE6B
MRSPWPVGVLRGQGVCRTCVGQDPADAQRRFRERVAELGGEVVGPYADTKTPVELRCAEGHPCSPTPSNVLRGSGLCNRCRGKSWNILYVVQDPKIGTVKFGVTSGDPGIRLDVHRRDNLTEVHRLREALPNTVAPDLERALKAVLRARGHRPVRGVEYFAREALEDVLAVVDDLLLIA